MLWNKNCNSQSRLDGKTAVITGCNTGIGKETAKDLYRRGCRVIMACRDVNKAEKAKAEIIEKVGIWRQKKGELVCEHLDLADLQSVRDFSYRILAKYDLHLLINNAGVCVAPKSTTADGFEMHMGVNHLGHFLLTLLLLPRLVKCQPARVINVSSVAYIFSSINFEDLNCEQKYQPFLAYSSSKLANILFTKELKQKYSSHGVSVCAVHPGIVGATEGSRHADSSMFKGAKYCYLKLSDVIGKNLREGAQTTLHCCLDQKVAQQKSFYYSNCKTAPLLPKAKDDASAARLWDISLKMVGLPKNFDPLETNSTPQFLLPELALVVERTKL